MDLELKQIEHYYGASIPNPYTRMTIYRKPAVGGKFRFHHEKK